MASSSSRICLNLVLKKAKLRVFSELNFRKFASPPAAAAPPSGVADQLKRLSSSPSLMLPREEEKEDVTTTDAAATKMLNLRFLTLAKDHHHHQVVKLRTKLPQPLLDAVCVGSSHGWLAYMNRRDCGIYLANFLNNESQSQSKSVLEAPPIPEIIPLPSIRTMPGFLRTVNDTHPDDPSHIDHFVFHDTKNRIATWNLEDPDIFAGTHVRRMALSSAPNHNNNECVVVIIYHFAHKDLAFCRLSSSSSSTSSSWFPLDSPLRRKDHGGFCDIVYSDKDQLFYALSNSGAIEAWDLNDPASSPRRWEVHIDYRDPPLTTKLGMKCAYMGYLVDLPPTSSSSSEGDILLVFRRRAIQDYETVGFDIWKLDIERRTGERVDNIGDYALFLGYNHSFALSTSTGGKLKPNTVYFADDTLTDDYYKTGHFEGNDMGIYNLEDRTITPLYSESEDIQPRPIWVAPNP